VIARGDTPRGEVALRRRETGDGPAYELIVNGAFVMDTLESTTEMELAGALLRVCPAPRHVLVGGLGLGFTVAALLRDPRVESVVVVELEADLVDWARRGLAPTLAAVAADGRARFVVADVAEVLGNGQPIDAHGRSWDEPSGGLWDGILLDVDNGPDFLVHEANSRLYSRAMLAAALDRRAPGGVLAIWSSAPAPGLLETLSSLGAAAAEVIEVSREGRRFDYAIYTLTAPGGHDALGPNG